MSDWSPEKEEAVMNAAKKSGKEILSGLSKASLQFTKRMAEGAFNAQMVSKQHTETGDKLKAAGNELGRAFLKGAIEGGTKALTGIISGVNEFSREMKESSKDQSDEDQNDPDALPPA